MAFCQKYNGDTICFNDTLLYESHPTIKAIPDSVNSYKVIRCQKRYNFGVRFEVGISRYFYNKKTKDWLGNHGGPNLNLILTYNKINVGIRFKPWTVNPKSELAFNGDTLPIYSELNPIKNDFFVGYSLDFKKNISIEPYLGITKTSFNVINEDELNKVYAIPKAYGFLLGATLNKYFEIQDYQYIAVFVNIGYSLVDYKKINSNLGIGYADFTIGVAYKGFFKNLFFKKLE